MAERFNVRVHDSLLLVEVIDSDSCEVFRDIIAHDRARLIAACETLAGAGYRCVTPWRKVGEYWTAEAEREPVPGEDGPGLEGGGGGESAKLGPGRADSE